MSPTAPGLRREQMAPESADFSALAAHTRRPLPVPSPRCLLSRAHLLVARVFFSPRPSPARGRDGEQVWGWGTNLWGHRSGLPAPLHPGNCFPPGTASPLLRKDPRHILGSRPTGGSWFPLLTLETQPSWGSALPEVLPVVGGLCRGRQWGCRVAAQGWRFSLCFGASCFRNWGCTSPLPEARRGAEVKEM